MNVFEIQNVACQYRSNYRPVLEIDHLQIEKGKVYFIVGSSGVGKSTILETLGIMNNTIKIKDGGFINFLADNQTIGLSELWSKSERTLAKFRSDYLSFIFQSTNLFNNLSAYQNACITQILKGHTSEEAELKARQLLSKLFPKEFVKEIVEGKKVVEMSGGQRQRLAFARALGSDYEVLLADEPTGNLDHHNANKLITILKNIVNRDKRTAIIVSHDIELSVNYGDRIVLISKKVEKVGKQEYKYGLIDESAVYRRIGDSLWANLGTQKEFSSTEMITMLKEAIKDTEN